VKGRLRIIAFAIALQELRAIELEEMIQAMPDGGRVSIIKRGPVFEGNECADIFHSRKIQVAIVAVGGISADFPHFKVTARADKQWDKMI
jgi:hypothetical protein